MNTEERLAAIETRLHNIEFAFSAYAALTVDLLPTVEQLSAKDMLNEYFDMNCDEWMAFRGFLNAK